MSDLRKKLFLRKLHNSTRPRPGFTVERATWGGAAPDTSDSALRTPSTGHFRQAGSSRHFPEGGPQGRKPWIQEWLIHLGQKAENQCSGTNWGCGVTV